MEKKMENEMESGVLKGLFRDPSIQIVPTLGPKVCRYYLHWAIWIPRETLKPLTLNASPKLSKRELQGPKTPDVKLILVVPWAEELQEARAQTVSTPRDLPEVKCSLAAIQVHIAFFGFVDPLRAKTSYAFFRSSNSATNYRGTHSYWHVWGNVVLGLGLPIS